MKIYFQIAERSISYAKIKHSDYKHHEKSEKRTLKTSFFDINQGEIGKTYKKYPFPFLHLRFFCDICTRKSINSTLGFRTQEIQRSREREKRSSST